METTIKISSGEKGWLRVRLPYAPERVAKIKTIAGRRWDGAEGLWLVPDGGAMAERLRALTR